MKKVLLIAIVIVFCMSFACAFVGCDNGEQLQVYVPDGAPLLAIANIVDSGKIGSYKANVTVSTGEDITTKCGSGQADIAVLPTNAAVKVCSTRNDYQLFTTNVWGLLYVIGSSNISSLDELSGKTVSSIGMGQTGEYLFKRILDVNDVSYTDKSGVTINYVAEGTTAVTSLMQNKCDFALVGEPLATTAINNAKSNGKMLYRVFDLQQLWQDVTKSDKEGYPQASVIVKKSLLRQEGFAAALYNVLSQNNEFLSQNIDRLTDILSSVNSSLKANFTIEIIERCNLNTVKACDIKQEIYDYLEQIGKQFTQMLKDDLYYEFKD